MSFDEPPRAEEMRKISKRAYEEYSALPSLVTLRDYSPPDPREFFKFAYRVPVVHEWFTNLSNVPDLVFYDIARSIGLSERAYLVKAMRDFRGATRRSGIDLGVLESVVMEMEEDGVPPTAILLPIDMYQEVGLRWNNLGNRIRYGSKESFIFGGKEIRLIWSNKFNPFEECFVVSKKFAQWIAKPSVKERLQVIFENDGSRITGILMQTLFYFQPIDEEGAVTIIARGQSE